MPTPTAAPADVQLTPEGAFPVPPFAQECLDAASEVWSASFEHPFVQALAEGTLDAERFAFYQMQDARYLEAFSDASALLSTRCTRPGDKQWFVEAALLALEVEGELHAGYGERFGYTPEDVATLELTPNNRAYQNHMISTAQRGTLVEGTAAVTPCPWLYIAIGQHLLSTRGAPSDEHPYAEWLRMYSDPEFNEYMENLLERLQRFADAGGEAARQRAKEAFATSARYEWMFWQQAWEQQEWPV